MRILLQDLRFGLRILRQSPGFTAIVVLTLALGIGAGTAIYSVVNSVLLNPIPGPEPERLMQISEPAYYKNKPIFSGVSTPIFEELQANQSQFSDFAWWNSTEMERKTDDFTDWLPGAMVSPNFFILFHVPPMLGRTFAEDDATPLNEDGSPSTNPVIVLRYSLWQSLFGGDPEVINRTIELSGHRYTVIGIMPPEFRFPAVNETQFWIPAEPSPGWRTDNIHVLVRLKPGVTEQQTRAMLDTMAPQMMKNYALDNGYGSEWRQRPEGLRLWIAPLRYEFQDSYGGEDLRGTLFGLLGAIGFVLLIACANVANLTLARSERRRQEFAVRTALGASRTRLARQLLSESLLISGLGGLGGLFISAWGMQLLALLIPNTMTRLKPIELDTHALGFALLVSLLCGLLLGMAPAWNAGQTRLSETIKQTGGRATAGIGRSRYRSALVVIEVALAVVLLAGAGLMIQSVVRLLHVDPGFDPENLLFVDLDLPWQKYEDMGREEASRQLRNTLFAQLRERFAALPGVTAVGILKVSIHRKVQLDGRMDEVDLDYGGCGEEGSDLFRTMRIPLLAGRYLDKSDIGVNPGATVISESMARLCWPGENAVGKKFHQQDKEYEVVGVVGDTRTYKYDQNLRPIFYRPYHELSVGLGGTLPRFVIRTKINPRGLIPAIRKELKEAEPDMRTPEISLIRQTLYEATKTRRVFTLYLLVFSCVGLLIAAIGIYGVLAYSVAKRTREIGIRIAVGAQRRDVLWMVMTEGAYLTAIGTVFGLLASYWLMQLLRNQLFEVSPLDPVVLAGAVLLLFAVALLACYIPARRAAKVNPMEALRYE